jgi:hypothetical protein
LHRTFPAAVVFWGALAVLAACNPDAERRTRIGECPQHWEGQQIRLVDQSGSETTITIGQLTVPGPITSVPEFHDCQRFIVGDGAAYDSLYAIFASSSLESITGADSTATNTVNPLANGAHLAAAEILSLGGTYEPLGIRPGFNCLYVYADTSAIAEDGEPIMRAKMHPVGSQEQECGNAANAAALSGKELSVRKDAPPEFRFEDYPAVARWDWDATNRKQYIGIKCGAAWCEVGDSGFVPSPVHDLPDASLRQRRVHRIKGWYDEQLLAERVTGKTMPTATFGRIVPHDSLFEYTVDDFHSEYRIVGFAIMPADPGNYPAKMNFEAGMNLIMLCMGSPQSCTVPDTVVEEAADAIPVGQPEETLFWAKVISSTGKERFRFVSRRAHLNLFATTGIRIPGTARWRWILADETNWFRCDEGCCEPMGPPP